MDLGELWKLLEGHLVPSHEFEERGPVDLCREYGLLDAELPGEQRVHGAENGKLPGLGPLKDIAHALRIDVGRSRLGAKLADIGAVTPEEQLHIALELEIIACRGLYPPCLLGGAGDHQHEIGVLLIAFESFAALLRQAGIDAAVFEYPERRSLAVQVVGHHLEASGHEGLAHHVEVLAQRVHDAHAALGGKSLQVVVVGGLGKRIVHYLHEAVGCEEVRYVVADGLLLRSRRGVHRHLHVAGQLYVVVAVDSENLLQHVALAAYVDHIGRGVDHGAARTLLHEVIAEPAEYVLYRFMAYLLSGKSLHPVIVEFDAPAGQRFGADLAYLALDLSSGVFLNEGHSPLERVEQHFGVASAFVAEGCVGLEPLGLGSAADRAGIKVGALDEQGDGAVGDSALLSAEHSGYAHGAAGVGNHHIAAAELAFNAVEGAYDLTLGRPADYHLPALHLVGVEGMQGLSELEKDIIGDVHDIVDGPEAYGREPVLHPLGRGGGLHASDRDAGISGGSVGVEDLDVESAVGVSLAEGVNRRSHELAGDAAQLEIGVQIPGDSPMGGGVHPVRGDFIFYHGLSLQMQIFPRGRADNGVLGEHHDSVVAGAESELVFGAYHSERFDTAYLGLLDLEVAGEHGSDAREEHLLAGRHVGSAAYHRQGFAGAVIDFSDMKMVGIRMVLAFEHFRDHHSRKTSGNLLLLFDPVDLDADGSHRLGDLRGAQLTLEIILEPTVTEFHIS